MKHIGLNADKRTVLGKKVKKLRREGILPANVYGKDMDSVAIQVVYTDFQTAQKEVAGGVIDLKVADKTYPVLIKSIQWNHQTHTPLHVDFYKVNLKEKVKTMVPLVLTGEAQAVADKLGIMLQTLSEVEVEALPDKLPENIEVDVTPLAEVNAQLTVGNVQAPADVTILTDPGQTVVRIAEPVVEEPEPEEETEAATAEGEAPTEETTEEAPAAAPTEEPQGE